MPLTDSPSRVMRRTMARLVPHVRLPCAACKGSGDVPDPAPVAIRPEPGPPAADNPFAAPEADPFASLPDADAFQFRQVLDLIGEARRTGEFSTAQADANVGLIERLTRAAAIPVTNRDTASTQAARMRDVVSEAKSTFVQPPPAAMSERAGKVPERAVTLLELLTPLKGFLVDATNDARLGHTEKLRGIELSRDLARAQKALRDARDKVAVRQIEHFQLRSLAWSIRKFGLRNHVMVAEPHWGASSVEPDATCVFFAGGASMRDEVARFCTKRGLTVKHAPGEGGSGQLRWDQVRESVIGIFDLTVSGARFRGSVCHALGIMLALGRYPLILAQEGRPLPFDVDVAVQHLTEAQRRSGIIARRIDEALFGLHPGTGESSVRTTARQLLRGSQIADAVELEEQLGAELQRAGRTPRVLVYPLWPAAYPNPRKRTCFHVMPFGKPWSGAVRDKVRRAVEAQGLEYRRGDQSRGVHVIRSIWDEICRASAVVVDLTGLNENVCLELGLAQAIGRPVLLMTQDDPARALFPEIAKLRVARYSSGRGDVRRIVQDWCAGLKPE
jgi:hypothetical protein